ncbi:MAG: gluconate 2-dehydrogenase subunit 3 family protein [Gemmatimonadaceae bacterium]
MTSSRRTFLTNLAGVGAAWFVADWAAINSAAAYAGQAVKQQPPPPFQVLTPDEAAQLSAMAERIMPTTDTPGAKEAGVIYFMDRAFATFEKEHIGDMRQGLADLRKRVGRRMRGATSFAALSPADQDAILKDMEDSDLFGGVRFMTMSGMFANPEYGGNRGQVGWKLINFQPRASHSPPFGYYDAEAAKGR